MAVNRRYTDANGQRGVDFFNIVVWRQQGENCAKYLAKGRPAAISGHLETRTYEDKRGVKHNVVEIIADEVQFLGGGEKVSAQVGNLPEGFVEMYDSQLPF